MRSNAPFLHRLGILVMGYGVRLLRLNNLAESIQFPHQLVISPHALIQLSNSIRAPASFVVLKHGE